MANAEHLEILRQGVDVWNAWRIKEHSASPDLCDADLHGSSLDHANLTHANLAKATLIRANLVEASLSRANLNGADLSVAALHGAALVEADLSRANLSGADLYGADFSDANLSRADLSGATLGGATLDRADLSGATLGGATLDRADLSGATLLETNLANATLTACRIYGVSAWDMKLSDGTKQQDLIITPEDQPAVTVEDLEVAQFVYLLLHNEKIRRVIDTVGRKGVLLLGRFTEGRIKVLNRLRDELRKRGYVPIVFNFDKPETKDFAETVRLLAGLSKFVIADITNPKSASLELQATVPEIMVPFLPIMQQGEKPLAMQRDLQPRHGWVFATLRYSSLDRLIETMDDEIIKPAEAKFKQLLARWAEPIEDRLV